MLIIKTLYRFLGLDVVLKYLRSNALDMIYNTICCVLILLFLQLIGAFVIKYHLDIPLHETLSQIINGTLEHKLVILIMLMFSGICAFVILCTGIIISLITLYCILIPFLVIIHAPKALIVRFKNTLNKVKEEDESHKDSN